MAPTSPAPSERARPFCKFELPAVAGVPAWGAPPPELTLADEEVHLWRHSLNPRDLSAADFCALLSADERARADRFVSSEHRRRFIIGRGWLRVVLGQYLRLAPSRLTFRYGAQGKPFLHPPTPVCFNLAHTDSLALVAVARDRAVGVDLERVRPVTEADAVAARFFSPREQRALRVTPPGARAEKFLRIWTGKEACAKAVGRRLDESLSEVEVLGADDRTERHAGIADETGRIAHCRLTELTPADDHVGTVATIGDVVVPWRGGCL